MTIPNIPLSTLVQLKRSRPDTGILESSIKSYFQGFYCFSKIREITYVAVNF